MIKQLWRKYYDLKSRLEILEACTAMVGDIQLENELDQLHAALDRFADLLANKREE